jgi:pantetheine-phosphate adenylyltransferase
MEKGGEMRKAVCPGSFDPVTNGHLDVFGRAADMYDEVVIGVLANSGKSPLFTVEERIEMLETAVSRWSNIKVATFDGLLVDFCTAADIRVIVKGLRAVSDFDYELQMAQMNYRLAKVETAFVATNPEYGYLSSSLIKEITRHGGDVTGLVPANVLAALKERNSNRGAQ